MNQATATRLRRTVVRQLVALLLLAAFYGLPWLRVGDAPALLVDLDTRQLHLFGLHLYSSQAAPLLWLALAAAAGLAFVTVLRGRLWCAYACPQTVLTRLFRALDRLTRFPKPIRPLGSLLRQLLWAVIAVWTGITFVGYFSPIGELASGFLSLSLGPWEYFWIAFYALATWANVIYLHEQVCSYLCPYSRLQQLLSDAGTPSVQYEASRGEPRGARALADESVLQRSRGLLDPVTASDYVFRSAHPDIAGALPLFAPAHLGDCVDCHACVAACPIGLDIRNGRSSSCIECGACMDACDTVMAQRGYPAGLVHRSCVPTAPEAPRRLRGKPWLFAAVCVGALAMALHGLLQLG
ncbi:MAG: 4Fe-4S dicluster domain-containing protein [Stenotrophomonas sp.]